MRSARSPRPRARGARRSARCGGRPSRGPRRQAGRGVALERHHGEPEIRCGRTAEEIHEDPLAPQGILVVKDPDGLVPPEGAEDLPRRIHRIDRARAGAASQRADFASTRGCSWRGPRRSRALPGRGGAPRSSQFRSDRRGGRPPARGRGHRGDARGPRGRSAQGARRPGCRRSRTRRRCDRGSQNTPRDASASVGRARDRARCSPRRDGGGAGPGHTKPSPNARPARAPARGVAPPESRGSAGRGCARHDASSAAAGREDLQVVP